MPLRDGATAEQGGFTYRLRRAGTLWILSIRDAAGVETDLYEFSEEPQTAMDVEVANHFTSTHPDSIFRKTLTIQRTPRDDRTILRSDVLTRMRQGRSSMRRSRASGCARSPARNSRSSCRSGRSCSRPKASRKVERRLAAVPGSAAPRRVNT